MISLQQRIAVITDTKANLVAQLRELDRLREQVGKALLAAPPQPKLWNGHAATSWSSPKMDREPALGDH
jgi:hypothetical protein